MSRIRVGVMFGGRNSEHEVSLRSARAVMEALDPERYDIVPIGIDKEGRWVLGGDPLLELEQRAESRLLGRAPEASPFGDQQVTRTSRGRLPDSSLPIGGAPIAGTHAIDVVIPVLHGSYGEDGTLQGFLDIADVAYVGCGVLAASVGMDKGVMKATFAAAGLPQLPYRLVLRRDVDANRDGVVAALEEDLDYPMFTKPANAGSSIGISKCTDREELAEGLREACRHDRRIVVEQGIPPRELECAVLGNDDPQASVVGEVIPGSDWYDYQDKYLGGTTEYGIPADIDASLAQRVRDLAVSAFKAIDGAGMARVDFLLHKVTGELYLNEVNTFPGFNAISMYPKLWQASGLSYPELLDRLIALAMERHRDSRTRE
ncbi:MAG: D-alanine--D-alanine ligase family protein [Myxococcota bacterium]